MAKPWNRKGELRGCVPALDYLGYWADPKGQSGQGGRRALTQAQLQSPRSQSRTLWVLLLAVLDKFGAVHKSWVSW